jgi:hypothetical protein
MTPATHNIHHYEPVSLTETERKHQTQMIMKLFELWKLTYKQQALMLGLSPNTETSIHRYKYNKQCLPLFRDIQDRVQHLLTIHKYLRQAYPLNKNLAYRWMTTQNSDFNNQSPLDVICQEGYMGLVKVRDYLELNLQT